MTPLQFAKAECCNYEGSGACAGVGIRDDGSPFSFGRKPKCVLGTPGVRCQFFEECVMPLADRHEVPLVRQEYTEAARFYRLSAGVKSEPNRLCPICKERELEKGKRYCYVCKDKKRRQSKRSYKKKQAMGGLEGTVVQKNRSNFPEKHGVNLGSKSKEGIDSGPPSKDQTIVPLEGGEL